MMKVIPVEEAIGTVLCHDITRIVPGSFKGRAFKKGHIITADDVPAMLDLGKKHIYVLDLTEGRIHEDDAAMRLPPAAAGPGIVCSEPSEGKVNLIAKNPGLLKVNVNALTAINKIEEIVFATLHTNTRIWPEKIVGGTRIVPLTTAKGKIQQIEKICRDNYPLIEIKPFRSAKVGIVTTGSEVYHGRIKDGFGPVLVRKFTELGSSILDQVFVSDDTEMTAAAIGDLIDRGAEFIAATGGMSVDPDDVTPASIIAAGGRVVTYGAPTLPGAMFMLAYRGDVPIVGLPGCVMYAKTSIFDLVVPRILAGDVIHRDDIAAMGHGGLCAGCPDCRYPDCGFGKGV